MTSPDPPAPTRLDALFTQGLTRPSGVRDQVRELGGTRAAAQQLGRSERTVRRWAQRESVPRRGGAAAQFRQAVDQARGPAPTSVREQIAELGGTRAVAEQLGRSERTVRRWSQQGRIPPAATTPFNEAIQRNRDTEEYRRRQIAGDRDRELRRGARFKFRGVAGPLTDSPGSSIKRRSIDFPLSPDAMSSILDAFYTGGTQAALDALSDAMAAEYMGSPDFHWQFRTDLAAALAFLYNQ